MRRIAVGAALAALVLGAFGCADGPRPPAWPPGTWVAASTPQLAALLEDLSGLGPSRLAQRAGAWRRALPDCERLEAHAPEGGLARALETLECAGPDGPAARLHALRGPRAAAFALPLGGEAHWLGTLDRGEAGDVEIELSAPAGAVGGVRRLLLPGAPAGPGVLAAAEALLHARLRPEGGIDLAALVPEGSQGAELFGLRSRLFSGLVLDGSWELAVYPPDPSRSVPDAALALGFRQRAAALSAVEIFLDEIQSRWSLGRRPFSAEGAEGACLTELGLLPELAPCYVAGERALVIGWNAESVRRALASGGARGPGAAWVIDLERLAEADARLAADAAEPSLRPLRWPWRRLRADGEAKQGWLRLRVLLEAAA